MTHSNTQIGEVGAWAESHSVEIVASYLDDGVSGVVPFHLRPGGGRLLADARAGRLAHVRGVVFLNHKRLGRTALVIHQAVEDVERQLGLEIVATREPVPREASPGARAMMRAIYAGVAQYDREDIIANSKAGMERAARAGAWLGGTPPFGYRAISFVSHDPPYVGKRLDLDEEQASVVRTIFRMYLSGSRLRPIADWLNVHGITPPPAYGSRARGRVWYFGTVRHVLRNPVYLGEMVWSNKRRPKNGRSLADPGEGIAFPVPALVSREDFTRAQEILRENQIKSPRNAKRFYLVRGLIRCGRCDRNFLGLHSRTKFCAHSYYKCGSHIDHRLIRRPCGNLGVRADFVDELVWRECLAFLAEPGRAVGEAREQLRRRRPIVPADTGRERERLAILIAGKDDERERVIRLAVRGTISEEEADAELKRLRSEAETLRGELRTIEERRREQGGSQAGEEFFLRSVEGTLRALAAAAAEGCTDDARRRIVLALVEQVVVMPPTMREPKRARIKIIFAFKATKAASKVSVRVSSL